MLRTELVNGNINAVAETWTNAKFFLNILFFLFHYHYLCVCTCHGVHAKVREQLCELSSLLPPSHGFLGPNPAWYHKHLDFVLSHPTSLWIINFIIQRFLFCRHSHAKVTTIHIRNHCWCLRTSSLPLLPQCLASLLIVIIIGYYCLVLNFK